MDFDFKIKTGSEVESKDGLVIFQTTEDVILKAGQTSVTAEAICETPGIVGNNYIIGSINNLITPLSYISTVENITVSITQFNNKRNKPKQLSFQQTNEK